MSIIEKINFLLQEKSISKKEFARRMRKLEPRLLASGDIPSEQTIYRYLNGSRELKVELIPCIAEVLGVNEQELFSFDIEYSSGYNYKQSKEIREILELLQYVPNGGIAKLKEQLLNYKKLYDEGLKV